MITKRDYKGLLIRFFSSGERSLAIRRSGYTTQTVDFYRYVTDFKPTILAPSSLSTWSD